MSQSLDLLHTFVKQGRIPEKAVPTISGFYESFLKSATSRDEAEKIFSFFVERAAEQFENPFIFEPYHQMVREPNDYFAFGVDFFRQIIDNDESEIFGKERLTKIEEQLRQGHNVIFFANHQSESDPLAISVLFEDEFPSIGENLISIAGDRVTSDPLAVPFSMGCNLLCIFSKRHIDHPPEKKHEKQLHNKKTMKLMSLLLKEGGKCIYVAPSGGRDRRNREGEIEIAPFDPQSIEMFYLMAKKSKTPTHFYPMALGTYDILPPPESIQLELGEERQVNRGGIHLSIGPQIDMDHFPGSNEADKHVRRKCRSDYIWDLVKKDYQLFSRG